VTAVSGDSSAHVAWKSVVNAQSYTVTVFPSEVQYDVKSPQNSFDANGLTNDTNYRFTVIAHVFGNASAPSKPSAWVTPKATTPTPTPTPTL
jgi:hypothetical protein